MNGFPEYRAHREYCSKCGMSFRLQEPYVVAGKTTCVVPGCERRFWHTQNKKGGPIVVGIVPADAKE